MKLPPVPSVAQLLRLYGVRALKDLSQNFLLDPSITDKFVRHAGKLKDKVVIEVGGGPGSLTRSILKAQPRKLYVIEKDTRMLPMLDLVAEASGGVAEIIPGDALHIDYEQLITQANVATQPTAAEGADSSAAAPAETDLHIIGNLPFGIATPLILSYLRQLSRRDSAFARSRPTLTLCFQREVGERICAPPRTKPRSRISVISQLYADVRPAFVIPSTAFVPAPKVEAMVVSFRPREQLPEGLEQLTFDQMERVLRIGYGSRLKRLRHVFSKHVGGLQAADDMLASAGFPAETRAFFLSTRQWIDLATAFYQHQSADGGGG
ncbi:dimethyladenosine transferase 1 [Salpingoeca rosetta]|uniref:rRNA adenine N(6)-methyltransferase n=1 Tax=Salpingoeca rosetta (strain ATCC 50818 / BSB-021) TaxID=946362 RepID=F2UTC2_SALR5|nr:dimethyladenosine transferase 1 [Salpingoeca rosetta]EGD82375.1 dimethyladenosine transferase 1 [Salpingoeca rosetta]|eukprot:XP_004987581.1 dimethyladenosine transferase 1 [Salpingoeca rosetta]